MSLAKTFAFGILMLVPAAAASADDYANSWDSHLGGQIVHKQVQATPSYSLRRPELTVGTRITMFANFLQEKPGVVMLDVGDTTAQCRVIDWQPHSVTLQLPRLGLARPTNAQLRIVLPNGRVAKKAAVLLISQPGIVVHQETVAQPSPSAGSDSGAEYAGSVGGYAF